MIVTVTMNPCIDKTVILDGFTYGGTNRVLSTRNDMAGKGLNVSMALKAYEIESMAISFEYNGNPGAVRTMLDSAGIPHILPAAAGGLRTNTKVFEQNARVMTELNEQGTPLSQAALADMRETILRAAADADFLVLSGSLPPQTPESFYREIIQKTVRRGLRCVLDSGRAAFCEALAAKPYLIKPNVFELEQLLGRTIETPEACVQAAREALSLGAEICCLSDGEKGAYIVSAKEAYFAEPLAVEVKSAQGAGDSMVAGLLDAMQRGLSLADMLKHGVAGASAKIVREGTQMGTVADYRKFCGDVRVVSV